MKMKPIRIFAPITRIDNEQQIVEGYAFVNETVKGEGGVRLKRTAMEAATPEYLRTGTVRAMHQPIAAGKPLEVNWDATGAMLRAKIVDMAEWEKVKEGVYKGFSVSVDPLTARGLDVETCDWWDTSLVDRGKDRDALFTVWRSDDHDEEREVEILPPLEIDTSIVARSFDDYLEEIAEDDLRQDLYSAWSWFMDCCWGCMDDPSSMQTNLDQFAAYCKTIIGGEMTEARAAVAAAIKRFKAAPIPEAGTRPAPTSGGEGSLSADGAAPSIERVAELEGERATILERAVAAETELARVQGALTERSAALATAEERVQVLENMPAPRRGPVRYPAALGRTFTANEFDGVDPERVQALKAKLETLKTETPKEPSAQKRAEAVTEYMAVERELLEMGVPVD